MISFFNENDHKQISYIVVFPKKFLLGDVQANKCNIGKEKKRLKKRKERRKFSSCFQLFKPVQRHQNLLQILRKKVKYKSQFKMFQDKDIQY